ncbi:MAG TPA: ATP-binding protein [Longimicrobiaceae bacterium]|nr:ATP-binding protein [Longimicrobiaceae bacterium]
MRPLPADPALLRGVALLADLPDGDLAWLAAHGEWLEYDHGEVVMVRGAPAETMVLVLEGELQARRPETGAEVVFRAAAGEISGVLPFSRMTVFVAEVRASGTTRVVRIPRASFPEMLRAVPELEPRLVGVMTDRVRENTRRDEQREKLMALGRLSAGLAHELNNPASAAGRAAQGLGEALSDAQRRTATLAERLGAAGVLALEEHLRGLEPPPAADPLARSDQEERVAEWLEAHGAPEGWAWAPTLVDTGVDISCLEELAADSDGALPETLGWLEATLRVRELLRAVEGSTGRISTLVKAVKSYTYMDQAPRQEVDLHEGLESTLTLLGHKLRGLEVRREYRRDLPRVPAYGGDLNQVWTNLVDNAADAMAGSGTLTVRTGAEGGRARVEIADTGPGIPAEALPRIWDPFFTTKEPGKGTGLGLEIARRIVEEKHGGELEVRSEPGDTCFRVWLPLG